MSLADFAVLQGQHFASHLNPLLHTFTFASFRVGGENVEGKEGFYSLFLSNSSHTGLHKLSLTSESNPEPRAPSVHPSDGETQNILYFCDLCVSAALQCTVAFQRRRRKRYMLGCIHITHLLLSLNVYVLLLKVLLILINGAAPWQTCGCDQRRW